MNNIDSILKTLYKRFNQMGRAHQQALLQHQYAFQDFFAKSIFKAELKSGTIDPYPKRLNEISLVNIIESELWEEEAFYAIISEWSDQAPRFRFESLGNYLLFFKALFLQDYELAIHSIKVKERMPMEEMRISLNQLKGRNTDSEGWNMLANYFFLKGKEIQGKK